MARFHKVQRFCYTIGSIAVISIVALLISRTMEHEFKRLTPDKEVLLGTQHSRDDKERMPIHDVYDGVRLFMLFIGYPRSGHTLVSSLLDSHTHVIIANEFDTIRRWKNWDAASRNKYLLLI